MKDLSSLCFLVLLSVLSMSTALGQSTPEQRGESSDTDLSFWAYGGPAATTLGIGAGGGVTMGIDRHQFSFRGVSTDPSLGSETWEVAFLYGRATAMENFFLSAGAGTSIIGGMRYPRLFGGGRGEKFDPMIGFPLQGQVAWTPSRVVSIGLLAFVNVNTAHPLGGLGMVLHLGQLQ